jgi:preprotein translocase subunit SecG
MENVVLTIHLILALCLIGVVLLQRSEGGGLGMGGGGAGATSGRAAATALTKLTWIFAIGFIITSITLTLIAAQNASGTSVVDQFGGSVAPAAPVAPLGTDLLPPAPADAPLTPPRADTAPTPAPATGN